MSKNLVKSNLISVKEIEDEDLFDKDEAQIEQILKMGAVAISLVTTNHAFGTVPLFQRFSPNDIQILDTGDFDRSKAPCVQDYLDKLVDEGIVSDGVVYSPLWAGASNQRKGEGIFCVRSKFWDIVDWSSCGAIKPQKASKLTCQKIAKYLALMMSTCKRWGDVFAGDEDMVYPEVENFAVLKDVEVPLQGVLDRTTPNSVVRDLILEIDNEKNKITDGFAMLVIDDTEWDDKKRFWFMKNHDTFTFRMSLHKGCIVIVLKTALIHFIKKYGIDSAVVDDAWGNKVNLLDCQVITFTSVFKGWKEFNSWHHYCCEFRKRGHEFWVCVQSHGHKWASLPYQQLQTLDATDEEVEQLAAISYDWLLGHCKVGEFGKIIGGNLGKLVDMYPNLLNDPYVQDALQRAWISKVKSCYGGRILHSSHNLMCAPDVVAVFQGIFGLPIVGAIPSGFVITNGFAAGNKLGITRCPHLDHAWFVAMNMRIPKEWLGFFGVGTTIFFSSHDNVMVMVQMDFDGDKVNVTTNKLLIEIAERSREKYGNVPPLYAAMDAGNAKSTCEDYEQELKALFKDLHKAPIGMYAVALNKLWIWAKAKFQDYLVRVLCVTRKANTCIDESGHGKDASIGVAEDVLSDFLKRKILKPMFMFFSKGSISGDGRDIIGKGNTRFYPSHTVDKYSAVMQLVLPKLIEDIADFSTVEEFDHTVLMKNSDITNNIKILRGLISDEGGLFNELCSGARDEEVMIQESSSLAAVREFTDDNIANMRIAVTEFAEKRGLTLDDAIDVITFILFYKMKRVNKFISQLKRWYFLAFGENVIQNVMTNLGKVNEDSYDTEDDDDDVDE